MPKILKMSRIRSFIYISICFIALIFIAPIVIDKAASYHKREQMISDFVDAAFSHRFRGNDDIEPMRLHRWEQNSIPVSFAAKPHNDCCDATAYSPRYTSLDAATLSEMSDEDKSFYAGVQEVLPGILNEFKDITGKSFFINTPPAPENDSARRRALPGLSIRPAFSPTKRRKRCLSIDQMALDNPPSIIYFYLDACGETDTIEGFMYYRTSTDVEFRQSSDHAVEHDGPIDWEITTSVCQFWPLENTSSANKVRARDCLARALGLPRMGVSDTDIEIRGNEVFVVSREARPKTSVQTLLQLLYCDELKSGMTAEQVKTILRGKTRCFLEIDRSQNP